MKLNTCSRHQSSGAEYVGDDYIKDPAATHFSLFYARLHLDRWQQRRSVGASYSR